ncbi:unnamed protein product, partial [Effrenium voratum]
WSSRAPLREHSSTAGRLTPQARRGFDAYWTPLFGDGSFAAQLCEADVDWIEPAGPAEEPQRRFRMTYSGLRLVIRKANQSFQATGAKQA